MHAQIFARTGRAGRRSGASAARRARGFLVILAAAVLAASACGTGGGEDAADDSASVNGLKAYDINPLPREKVKEGGTLRWGLGEFPTQWNQNHVDGNLDAVEKVISALMPRPFVSDRRGEVTANPDYLTAAEVTETEPKQVVTLTLNPKAKWSDGKPITWRDYQAQWQAMNGRNNAYRAATTAGYAEIEKVARGEDDHQVVITFATPFADWRSLFTPLYPSSTNSSPDAFNNGWLNEIPVTAGPFKFGRFDRGAKTLTIVRDSAWWGEEARLDRIVYRGLDGARLVSAFIAGELDVAELGPSAADIQRVRSAAGAEVRQAAGPDYRQLTLNGESPALSDVRVRQAIALGVNREAIAQSDLQGLDWPATLLNNHFFMNTQVGYRDGAGELGGYDPAKAERLLDEAGWVKKGDVRVKGGKELRLRFVIPSGLQLARSEGELVKRALEQIGIAVDVKTVPSDEFFTGYVIPGKFDIAPFSYVGTPFPVTSSFAQYANAAEGDRQWNANLGRIGSPEIDAAMRKAISALDPADARAHANAADRLIWQAVNVLPLYQRPQSVAVRATTANIGARGFHSLRYQDIGFTE
jgi:ABC-type dipeptide transport system, periplasmic component